AALQACRDTANSTRVLDPDAGGGSMRCTIKIDLGNGRYLATEPGVLMDDTGDSPNVATYGYEIAGNGDGARIIFSPTSSSPTPLFRNLNRYIRPKFTNITFVGGNTNAIWNYNASNGIAQEGIVDECQLWGTWAAGLQLDALHTLMGNCTISQANPGAVTFNNHGLAVNQTVVFGTSGSLPSPLVAGQVYWIVSVIDANNFTIANNKGGT